MLKSLLKKCAVFAVLLALTVSFSACEERLSKDEERWKGIEESGSGTKLNLVFFGEEALQDLLLDKYAPALKSSYGISLEVERKKPEDLIADLSSHVQDENLSGDIDLAIVDEKTLVELKKKNLLFKPFTLKLPNFSSYIKADDIAASHAGFEEIWTMAVPFRQNQLAFFYNDDLLFDPPESLDALKDFLLKNSGKFTYPSPKGELGKAFVQSVILDFVDYEEFFKDDLSEAELRKLINPGLGYLRGISSNLYGSGRVYPLNIEDYDALFNAGEIQMAMSLDHLHAELMQPDLKYPQATRPFELMKRSVSTRNYIVIPFNSRNKSGAMCAINALLEPSMQLSIYTNEDYSGTPVYSKKALNGNVKKNLDKSGKKTISKPSKLIELRSPEIPEKYWVYILREWEKMF